MPEGDTIYRTAARLRKVLEGHWILAARTRVEQLDANRLAGQQVAAIEARGKHLLIHLQDQSVIHSHLGMTGSWHVYNHGQLWQKPPARASLVLDLTEHQCVCFTPKILEVVSSHALRVHPLIARLGPDLLGAHFDFDQAISRLQAAARLPIGEAIMNQTLVCGVGNVYKSELLFLRRLNPFLQVECLHDGELRQLLVQAQTLLRANLLGFPRRTRFGRDGQRVWVYGRSGQPCFVCSTPILMRRQGTLGRSTYWCPTCQSDDER